MAPFRLFQIQFSPLKCHCKQQCAERTSTNSASGRYAASVCLLLRETASRRHGSRAVFDSAFLCNIRNSQRIKLNLRILKSEIEIIAGLLFN